MTPDERALLQRYLQDLVQTRGVVKDAEADGLIQGALRASPDAAYVLVQHAILSDQALHAAQDQIASLQNQLRAAQSVPAPAPAGGFLGGGPSPWAQAAAAPTASSSYGPGPFSTGGGLGSFLRNVGTTAAGVAGGALLFDGITSLFGGGRGFGGFGGFGGGYGGPTEVINNYYEDGGGAGGGDWDAGGWDDPGGDT